MVEPIISVLFLLVLLVGLTGTIVPVLPGILLMWAGVASYGLVAGFDAIAVTAIVVVTVLAVISVVLGVVLPKQAADAAGASKRSQWAAVLGAIIGFFAIPVVGVIIGAVVGIAIAEYSDKNDWGAAWESTKGVLGGMGLAALAQFAIGVVILAIWVGWAALETL